MERFALTQTSDGSYTLWDGLAGETFKSRHAARVESEKVFIEPGFTKHPLKDLPSFRVLEFGFGLGTNCRALADAATLLEPDCRVEYVGIDRETTALSYLLPLDPDLARYPWLAELLANGDVLPSTKFHARFLSGDFLTVAQALSSTCSELFHSIFFDPFSPKANPMAWTAPYFEMAYALLVPGGRLVTYSVSRITKSGLEKAGFRVHKYKLPAILNKREALFAEKPATASERLLQ